MREILFALAIPVVQMVGLVLLGLILRVDRKQEGDE